MWKRKSSTDMKVNLEETQKRLRHRWKDSKHRVKEENEQNGYQEKVLNVKEMTI